VERTYTKDQILELYLNAIYYGPGSYGIDAASRNYFEQVPSGLDQEQQLFLAGVVRGPALYDPYWHCPAARRRIDEVIAARLDAGSLSAAEAEALRAARSSMPAGSAKRSTEMGTLRIPQGTDRIARLVVKVADLQRLYEVDNPPDHRPQEQLVDR
jgi:membrane peptidoglycan carboxypeptidase